MFTAKRHHMKGLLEFARKYPGWHSFASDALTRKTVRQLEKVNLIVVNKYQQFTINPRHWDHEQYLDMMELPLDGLFGQLLSGAISEINWFELASHYREYLDLNWTFLGQGNRAYWQNEDTGIFCATENEHDLPENEAGYEDLNHLLHIYQDEAFEVSA